MRQVFDPAHFREKRPWKEDSPLSLRIAEILAGGQLGHDNPRERKRHVSRGAKS